MNQSTTIANLAEALAKAQSKIKKADLDAKNPHYDSRYATFSSVREASREALSENGLAVVQSVNSEPDGYHLETTLMHSSGEFITAKLKLLLGKSDMQGLGSAITYAKRYQFAAMVGVVDEEDDDGNGASGPSKNAGQQAASQQSGPKPKITAKDEKKTPPPDHPMVMLSRILKEKKCLEEVKAHVAEVYKVASTKDLNEAQLLEVIELVRSGIIRPGHRPPVAGNQGASAPAAGGSQPADGMIHSSEGLTLAQGAVSEAQLTRLWTIADASRWAPNQVHEFLNVALGVTSSKFIHWRDYEKVIGTIQSMTPAAAMKQFDEPGSAG